MEAIVNEALGNVLGGDVGTLLQLAEVHDELVGAGAVLALEQHLVAALQLGSHVVGIQDCTLGCLQSWAAISTVDWEGDTALEQGTSVLNP